MASKPRTNDEALRLFAANLASNEVGPRITVNSIVLEGDTIYHYGHHYPMAKIVRKIKQSKTTPGWTRNALSGPPIEVHVNSTPWHGASGWGSSTNSIVSSLRQMFKGYGVRIIDTPLTGDIVLVENADGDDMPTIPELNIPPCPKTNVPTDPGPEPVKDPAGCIAGTTFEAEYSEYKRTYEDDPRYPSLSRDAPVGSVYRSLRFYSDGSGPALMAHVSGIERVYFGESSYRYGEKGIPAGHDYKQCPHCKAHDARRESWRVRMFGGYGRGSRMGWSQYSEQIALFGDAETWTIARSALMTLRKRRQKALSEWMGRNSMPHHRVPTEQRGNVILPMIDTETGRVKREVLLKAERAEKRRVAKLRKQAREARTLELLAQAERERKTQEMRERLDAGEMVDETIPAWLAQHDVAITDDGKRAILYKRINRQMCATSGARPFKYTVGEWAIADDYMPTPHCGHGLHFAQSVEQTSFHYGEIVIECEVPIAGIVNMAYKVKAERAFVRRIVNNEEN